VFNKHKRQWKKDIRDVGEEMSSKARERLQELREGASNLYERGREKAEVWSEDLQEAVRERPLQSLFIAAGLGIAVGFLLTVLGKGGRSDFGERH
jgi:ElaB/YqjD/DUF883 family membrane-anchored ribosome-binding protein